EQVVEEKPIVSEPVQPTVQVREPVARREEAAQVVTHEGHPKILKNKEAYAPFVFFAGSLDGKVDSQVADEVKLAAEYGVRLFMLGFDLVNDPAKVDSTAKSIIEQVEAVAKVAPDAQVLLRLNF